MPRIHDIAEILFLFVTVAFGYREVGPAAAASVLDHVEQQPVPMVDFELTQDRGIWDNFAVLLHHELNSWILGDWANIGLLVDQILFDRADGGAPVDVQIVGFSSDPELHGHVNFGDNSGIDIDGLISSPDVIAE